MEITYGSVVEYKSGYIGKGNFSSWPGHVWKGSLSEIMHLNFIMIEIVNDYIQIPWEEVDYIAASVMRKGKSIPRFSIHTKKSGDFSFSTQEPKAVLRAINQYIPGDRMLRSLTFREVLTRNVKRKVNRLRGKSEE